MNGQRIKELLDSALEHASHAWAKGEQVWPDAINKGSWPPQISYQHVGTVPYHLAAMIEYVYQAYGLIEK